METVIARLLHQEQKVKGHGGVPLNGASQQEEVMNVRHKRKGIRCHFCKKLGHIQRFCKEKEKRSNTPQGQPSDRSVAKGVIPKAHKANNVKTKAPDDSADSNEVGLVHVLSADKSCSESGSLTLVPPVTFVMIKIFFANCIL